MSWYFGNTIITAIGYGFGDLLSGGNGEALYGLVEWCCIIWGPLFDIIVILWAIVSSGRVTTESQIY